MRRISIGAIITLCSALPAFGSFVLLDDFNRSDSTNLGPAWLEVVSDFSIQSQQARSTDYGLMVFTGPTGFNPQDWISVDAIHTGQPVAQYAGLVLGYASPTDNVVLKLQSNNCTGMFERLYFRYGNGSSSSAWAGMTGGASFLNLPTPVSQARMRARIEGDQVIVQLDTDMNGTWDQTYTRGGLPTANLGTGVGVVDYDGILDNFGGYLVPEPAMAALLGIGLLAFRRSRRLGVCRGLRNLSSHAWLLAAAVWLLPLAGTVWATSPVTLTVINGTGSGQYQPGDVVRIEAVVPACMRFDKWSCACDVASSIEDVFQNPTNIYIGNTDLTIEAFFKPIPGCDQCPDDALKLAPGVCGCGTPDTDRDGDGIPDCNDDCPDNSSKVVPGQCGCGAADRDSDGDNVVDCQDGCRNDPAKYEPGICGCGTPDTDTDNDGVADCNDGCPADPAKSAPGACGCGVVDDADGDGASDCGGGGDGCPNDPLKTSPGQCGCGKLDTDTDEDGLADCIDLCPELAGNSQIDGDGDGVGDDCDNCPVVSNFDQADSDGNGVGDACTPQYQPAGQPQPGTDGSSAKYEAISYICGCPLCGVGATQAIMISLARLLGFRFLPRRREW